MFRIITTAAAVLLLLAACGEAGGERPKPTPTERANGAETPARSPTPTPAAEPTPTPVLQTYRNEKYEYSVTLPEGWRVASSFVELFAERISSPRLTVVPEDYASLTSLTEREEQQAAEEASEGLAIGLAPWYGFAEGRSIHIFPVEVIYPGVTIDSYLVDVDTGGIIRQNSEVREETLDSGRPAVRVTRREVDDNGDFTYDLVIVRASANEDKGFIIRIVKTPDYDEEAFEAIFRSFRND